MGVQSDSDAFVGANQILEDIGRFDLYDPSTMFITYLTTRKVVPAQRLYHYTRFKSVTEFPYIRVYSLGSFRRSITTLLA